MSERSSWIKINRIFAPPNHQTFLIKPIKELLERYVGDGKGWIDPFAGANSPAEFTNDLNPDMPTDYHLDALPFSELIPGPVVGVLFDPPYSYRQIKEHYQAVGIKTRSIDTSFNFYNRVMNALAPKVKQGGYTISFGWNSNGFGKSKGFRLIEILLVAHGMHHNDTIVTMEVKV